MRNLLIAAAVALPVSMNFSMPAFADDRTATLEDRLDMYEDVAAIERLTHDYGRAIDKQPGKDYDEALLRTVFAKDATWSAPAFDINVNGIDQIATFIGQGLTQYQSALHLFAAPRIDIAGDTAVGTWQLWFGAVDAQGTSIALQTETLEYVRTEDGWRISSLVLNPAGRVVGK